MTTDLLLDELASQTLAADETDSQSLEDLAALAARVHAEIKHVAKAGVAAKVGDIAKLAAAAAAGKVPSVSQALAEISDLVTAAQESHRGGSAEGSTGSGAAPGALEAQLLADFVRSAPLALDDLESDVLAVERRSAGAFAALRRRVHTFKGDAALLQLGSIAEVFHATEDLLQSDETAPQMTDRILQVIDWTRKVVTHYASDSAPSAALLASGREILSTMRGLTPPPLVAIPPASAARDAGSEAATSNAPPVTDAEESETPGVRVERDEETLMLLAEFFQESDESLARVDQTLMAIEQSGPLPDSVNILFRAFHTIKGIAGFLELADIAELTHAIETLLDQVRQGRLALDGAVVDLVFDGTEVLGRLLQLGRKAVERSESLPLSPVVPKLVQRLRAATGDAAAKPAPVPPGAQLGKILSRAPHNVPPEAVDEALSRQQVSGKKIGEELVDMGVVRPKQVVEALHTQSIAVADALPTPPLKAQETIKVDLARVDTLVEAIGELVIAESMVVNDPDIVARLSQRSRNYLGQMTKITRDLQALGMRIRMVPLRGVFQKVSRLVRDLSKKSDKQVNLVVSGEGTEMDRSMVERIADPLVHMIRNSVDHGVESAEDRLRVGKRAEGTIRLSAFREGGGIVIEIADDGRGLNRDAILRKAQAQGIIKDADALSDSDVCNLIFLPGFSTATKVTEISGRGVGMDVVKRSVEQMRGRIQTTSVPGQGTTFRIILPLTTAIIDGMVVVAGPERYIVPTASIVESLQPKRSMLGSLAGTAEYLTVRGEVLPFLRLERVFGIPAAKVDPTEALVLILETTGKKFGLLVDDVIAQQQVVIKALGSGMSDVPFVAGAAILPDGAVGLILNVDELAMEAHGAKQRASA